MVTFNSYVKLPEGISWLINPMNYSYVQHKPQLTTLLGNLAILGAHRCPILQCCWDLIGFFWEEFGVFGAMVWPIYRCFLMIYLLQMVILHGYVKLPQGKLPFSYGFSYGFPIKTSIFLCDLLGSLDVLGGFNVFFFWNLTIKDMEIQLIQLINAGRLIIAGGCAIHTYIYMYVYTYIYILGIIWDYHDPLWDSRSYRFLPTSIME